MDASFERIDGLEAGDAAHGPPLSPVVLSVPHAGREYPPTLRAALRLPPSALVILEDRYVDHLAMAARTVETMFVQRRARAWIDLNRSETERDPRVDEGASTQAMPVQSAKLRSGLGLVPRRAGAAGDLWRRRFSAPEIAERITRDYRPYHAAVGAALAAARARFGIAVLIDLHSMPPAAHQASIVLGDRFGQTSVSRFIGRLESEAAAMGIRTALNTPYAGGHILERHAAPLAGIHAVQIEVDRSLYLDARLDTVGAGAPRTIALLRRMLAAVTEEALSRPSGEPGFSLAAE